jgi:multidrug efflux system outer membrane protein
VLAGLTGPIFTAGSIAGQVHTAEAGAREAVANYQGTLLTALRETNDALIGSVKKQQEAQAQAMRVASLREYARLGRVRFRNGYASYLEVLYAENELFSAELAAVSSNGERLAQLVNVYKALGGGWIDIADRATAAGQERQVAERAPAQPMF